jgi:ScaI restriction endonuclease
MTNPIKSHYFGKDTSEWINITNQLIEKHPLKSDEIVEIVLKSWNDIFNSKIGSFFIGKDISPTPQIMSFLLHELVAHYVNLRYPDLFKVGIQKREKDIHCITDSDLSIEIKGSSHPNQIFGNRSYAQPQTEKGQKNKDGYYLTINFEKFDDKTERNSEILSIRFGYIEHTDWIAQASATGQQARLAPYVYEHKLKILYQKAKLK